MAAPASQSLTQNQWTVLGRGLTAALVQAIGPDMQVYVGNSDPTAASIGFPVPGNIPFSVPNVGDFGGTVAIFTPNANGRVIYAVA